MKRLESLLMIIFATLSFTGCSNEFEKIFNGEDKETISPLVSGQETAVLDNRLQDRCDGSVDDVAKDAFRQPRVL